MGSKVFVIHPFLKIETKNPSFNPQDLLDEACGLTEAINLEIIEKEMVSISRVNSGTYIGKGVLERIRGIVAAGDIELVFINHDVSPVQQRNLEKTLKTKVIDRTGLILEIFGARAQTAEGKLQVELASLIYQKSRLVKSWTHLERQRGGFGFIGGPGESQLEIDKRIIGERIIKLKGEIANVKRTRSLQRNARKKVPFPMVSLVGYTNTGKSTLFNRLTNSAVLVQDMLFATLDPTLRLLKLPSGRQIILSDTVGFISKLPHQLVAAFQATLEEVLEASVILHIRDISHSQTEFQNEEVHKVLKNIGHDDQKPLIEVLNKADCLSLDQKDTLKNQIERADFQVLTSALTGEGCHDVLKLIDDFLDIESTLKTYQIKHTQTEAIAWLFRHANVKDQITEDEYTTVVVQITPEKSAQFEKKYLINL